MEVKQLKFWPWCLLIWTTMFCLVGKLLSEKFPNVMKTEEIVRTACVKNTESEKVPKTDPKAEIEKTMVEFPMVFEEPSLDGGKLKPMKGGPMTIHMKKGKIKPTHIYTARKCPYVFEEYAKDELDKSENMGIIQKVEGATHGVHHAHLSPNPEEDVGLLRISKV